MRGSRRRTLRKAVKQVDPPVRSQAERWVAERRRQAEQQVPEQDSKLEEGNQRVEGESDEGSAPAGREGADAVTRPYWPAPWIDHR
jgi:hypothetical protein